VSGGSADRNMNFAVNEETGKNGKSSGNSAFIQKDLPPGESHPPEKAESVKLQKWPGAELSKLLSTYARDGKLGEKQPGMKLDAAKGPFFILITTGEGRFQSETNTCSAASRVDAWKRLHESMEKMLSPKQIAALEASCP